MENLELLSPGCVIASYTPQRIPQFQGNPLIEALPPSMSDDELFESLSLLPDFAPEQRTWETHERMHMLQSLQNFLVPLGRHFELARALDSMMRAGYVGRAPCTPEHARVFQAIYEKQKAGIPFSQSATTRTPQISTALVGLSGLGKTTTVKRWQAHIPNVIYHPELKVYQVPYLHVEMPSDGSSIKGLAHGILHKLDELIPGADYYQTFAVKGRPGADTLMRSVARLLHMHVVGLLVCDEVQNLANSHKGAQTVMTELVSACNDLHVPILFIGTNKAAKVLSLDFRQSRRASGHGLAPWDRLRNDVGEDEADEWHELMQVMWRHQWVRRPVELNALLLDTMYEYSQGVIDIAIKLFASCQARAMLDGTETITPELISDVYRRELKLLHPMIDALRANDIERLAAFDDVAPLGLSEILGSLGRKLQVKKSPLYAVRPGAKTFTQRIAAGLVATGFGEDEAESAAKEVEQAGKAKNLVDGAKAALDALTTPKRVVRGKAPQPTPRFDERPGDYRHALFLARESKTPVLNVLRQLQITAPLDELVGLE